MTHILKVTTWHPYIDGIAGIFVLEQAAALQSVGVHVGMIFSRIEGLQSFTLPRMTRGFPGIVHLDRPVPTIGFKTWCPPKALALTPLVHTAVMRRLYDSYVRTHGEPDLLHGHVALEGGRATRDISRRTNKPYVITEHSTEIQKGGLTPERQKIARDVYGDARHVIAVSDQLADRIRQICPEANVRVVGNLVRNFVFEARKERPTRGQRLTIVTISSLVPHKRVHHAIEALSRLPDALKARLKYVIVGEGRQRAQLEVAARNSSLNIEFLGSLPHCKAMAVLADADMLLHPSILETFGVVLIEALALGLPVVATRCGAPEEFLSDKTGALVDRNDVEGLTAAVLKILEDIDRWHLKSETLSTYASSRFSEESVARAIMETYK